MWKGNFSPWDIIQGPDSEQGNGQHLLKWFYDKWLLCCCTSYQILTKWRDIKA